MYIRHQQTAYYNLFVQIPPQKCVNHRNTKKQVHVPIYMPVQEKRVCILNGYVESDVRNTESSGAGEASKVVYPRLAPRAQHWCAYAGHSNENGKQESIGNR
jgi:hypothetical protein